MNAHTSDLFILTMLVIFKRFTSTWFKEGLVELLLMPTEPFLKEQSWHLAYILQGWCLCQNHQDCQQLYDCSVYNTSDSANLSPTVALISDSEDASVLQSPAALNLQCCREPAPVCSHRGWWIEGFAGEEAVCCWWWWGGTQRDAWTDRPEVAAVCPDGDWWDDEEIRAKKVEKRLHSCCWGACKTDGKTGERKVNQGLTEMMSPGKSHQNGGWGREERGRRDLWKEEIRGQNGVVGGMGNKGEWQDCICGMRRKKGEMG